MGTGRVIPCVRYLDRVSLAGCLHQVNLSPKVALVTVITETDQDRFTCPGLDDSGTVGKALRPEVARFVSTTGYGTILYNWLPMFPGIKTVIDMIVHLWARWIARGHVGDCMDFDYRLGWLYRKGHFLLLLEVLFSPLARG